MTKGKYDIFDKMIEGIQIIDPEFKYVYVNDTVATHGKMTREELVGQPMMEKYPGIENTEMFALLRQCMKERQYVEMVNEFDFPDGSKGYFELRMQAVPEGVLILSIDITSLKRAEQVLKSANEELEAKVNERTAELIAKNRELEQFVYIASHDLQEPIRTISNFAGVLTEKYTGVLDKRADKSLHFIKESSKRMQLLITGLLDYSRIGRDKVKKKLDSNAVLQEVLIDMSSLIEESKAEIKSAKLPSVYGFHNEFRQLLQNLISNAIKFRMKETTPEIYIDSEKRKNEWVFSVKDNGIGVEHEFREKIFLIFQRLHNRGDYEGTGIGLAHCKKIVDLHKGKIWVESEPGKGSVFFFSIPEQ